MIPLPIDKINALTPYCVKLFERDGSYRFVTDNDVQFILNEATIIVRNDNPNMVQLINEFSETAQLLSHKPNGDN